MLLYMCVFISILVEADIPCEEFTTFEDVSILWYSSNRAFSSV